MGSLRERYKPIKRRALDGVVWWCIYDMEKGKWSTNIYHGKYKTKREAQYIIDKTEILMEDFDKHVRSSH